MTHTIRQQHLHIEVNGSETDALALQNRLSGLCQDRLLPALERTLDRYVPITEYWSLDRLDIDVGVLSLERLEQDLAELVTQAVEKKLREQTLNKPFSTIVTNDIHYKTSQQSLAEALVYFLKTGRLPWSMQLPEGKNFEQTLLDASQDTTLISINPAVILSALSSVIARKRLIRQFSPLFITRLVAQLSPDSKKVMEAILLILQNSAAPVVTIKQFEKQLWETVFSFIATAKTVTENAVIAEAWQTLNLPETQHSALENLLIRYWSAVIKTTNNHPSSLTKLAKPSLPSSTAPKNKLPDAIIARPIDPKQENLQRFTPAKQAFETDEIKEGIYIENAGLILLHPFLPQFFEALGIAAEDKLIQPERALCLLHFLTTGLLIAPEYELTLCKILCNVPLDATVESDMELTEFETDEAEALLKAVIRHWEALRNTGIDGLRGEFLLRFGKLSVRDDGDWLLQVEAKTADILLTQLPWGISMIKLPWMQQMLWVEWPY